MSNPPGIVVDTNVVISRVIAPRGPVAAVFGLIGQGVVRLVVSEAILSEVARTLHKPQVAKRQTLSEEHLDEIVARIRAIAAVVAPTEQIAAVKDDLSDDKFIEAAVAGGAQYIVTGDKHLLALGSYQGIQILTPAMFVRLFDDN